MTVGNHLSNNFSTKHSKAFQTNRATIPRHSLQVRKRNMSHVPVRTVVFYHKRFPSSSSSYRTYSRRFSSVRAGGRISKERRGRFGTIPISSGVSSSILSTVSAASFCSSSSSISSFNSPLPHQRCHSAQTLLHKIRSLRHISSAGSLHMFQLAGSHQILLICRSLSLLLLG